MPVYKSEKHTAIINSIDGVAGMSSGCGAPEIVTGSRDGVIFDYFVKADELKFFKFRFGYGMGYATKRRSRCQVFTY